MQLLQRVYFLLMHLVEDMDYEEDTSTITNSDAVPSVNAELNNSPEVSDVSTAATGLEGQ